MPQNVPSHELELLSKQSKLGRKMEPEVNGGRTMKPVTNQQWLTYFDRNQQFMSPAIINKALHLVHYGNAEWFTSLSKSDACQIKAAQLYYESSGITLKNYERH